MRTTTKAVLLIGVVSLRCITNDGRKAGLLNLGFGDGKDTDFALTLYPWGQISHYPLDRRVAQSIPAALPGWTCK